MRKTVTFLRSLQPKMAPQAALPPDSWGRGVKSGSSAAQKSRSCHKRTMSCEKTSFVPRQNDPLGLFRFNVLLCYLGFCAQDTSGTPKTTWHERNFCTKGPPFMARTRLLRSRRTGLGACASWLGALRFNNAKGRRARTRRPALTLEPATRLELVTPALRERCSTN